MRRSTTSRWITKPAGGPPPVDQVIAIFAGIRSSFALKTGGKLWAWGLNSGFAAGQLGDGTNVDIVLPTELLGPIAGVTQVSSSQGTTFILQAGALKATGDNSQGAFGDGTTISSLSYVPAATSNLPAAPTKILNASGSQGNMGAVIVADGTAWAWGNNAQGNLGNVPTFGLTTLVPVQMGGLDANAVQGFFSIADSYIVQSNGKVRAWALNGLGQFGNAMSSNSPGDPVGDFATGIATAIQVEGCANDNSSIYLLSDGTLRVQGFNAAGEWGNGAADFPNGSTTGLPPPGPALPPVNPGMTNVAKVAAMQGAFAFVALKNDGTVWIAGNQFSALATPTLWTQIFSNAIDIACGDDHLLILKNDHTVWGFGRNGSDQLGDGTFVDAQVTPVQALI